MEVSKGKGGAKGQCVPHFSETNMNLTLAMANKITFIQDTRILCLSILTGHIMLPVTETLLLCVSTQGNIFTVRCHNVENGNLDKQSIAIHASL